MGTDEAESTTNKQMAGFVTAVANSIKNPVSSLLVAVDFIEKEVGKTSRGEVMDAAGIQALLGQVRLRLYSLNSYVDELIGYAKPVEILPRFVKAKPLFADITSALAKSAIWRGSLGVHIAEAAAEIYCDPEIFTILCKSIIVNALEAMPPDLNPNIEIDVTAELAAPRGTRITIKDNGPGIDSAHLADVGKPFFTTKGGSTGLGLALAKQYTEAHGGELKVFGSSDLGGAEVVLFLPQPPSLSKRQ